VNLDQTGLVGRPNLDIEEELARLRFPSGSRETDGQTDESTSVETELNFSKN